MTVRSCDQFSPPGMPSLACPQCHGAVNSTGDALACPGCGVDYPYVCGVPDFAPDSELYWGELSPTQMSEAIRLARAAGYEAAARYAATCVPSLEPYMMSEFRIDWLFHAVPLDTEGSCLDVGSGWGTLSRALTRYFRTVFSLEIVRERIAFQRAFQAKEGLRNLEIVRASVTRLPFPDKSFDLVLANGIIQWVGLVDHGRPVPDLQQEFLRECLRVLRPGGALVMGCENRFGIFQFLGASDHSGLRYTALLPRRLADWAVRRHRHTGGAFVSAFRGRDEWADYRTWTYSSWGYEKLLRDAGFAAVDSYWVYPSDNFPSMMGRLNDGNSVRELLEFASRNIDFRVEGSAFSKFFLKLRWAARATPLMRLVQRLLTPDMFFIARRSGQDVRATALDSAVGSYSLRWSGSNKIVWLARTAAIPSVVKGARFPRQETEVAEEERTLGERNDLSVQADRRGRWTLYREPYLDGRPIDCLSSAHNRLALEWLLSFQGETRVGTVTAEAWVREIQLWLKRFEQLETEAADRALARNACDKVIDLSGSAGWPRPSEHGDYWWRNILKRPDGGLYVIDWQHHRKEGDPLFDFALFTYTHWDTARKQNQATAHSQMSELVDSFCGRTRIEPGLVYAYYPYSIIRRIVRSSVLQRTRLLRALRGGIVPELPQ